MGYASDYGRGRSGDNSLGTPGNKDGYKAYRQNQEEWHEKLNTLIRDNGKDLRSNSLTPETPAPTPESPFSVKPLISDPYSIRHKRTTYEDTSSSRDWETGFFETLVHYIKVLTLLGLFAFFVVGGGIALYEKIGPEGFVLIGLYVFVATAVAGYALLLYRGLEDFFEYKCTHLLAWIVSLSVSAIVCLTVLHFVLK